MCLVFFLLFSTQKNLIHSALLKLHSLSSNGRGRGRKGYVQGSGHQAACGGGILARCVAVPVSRTPEIQVAGDCIFHSLNKQPLEGLGAGGDVTCGDVFSFQQQEAVLDFGGSDPAEGRAVAACGDGTPPHQCGSPRAVPPAQPGSHQPHNGQWSLGIFPYAPCTLPGRSRSCCPNTSIPLAWPSGRDTQ